MSTDPIEPSASSAMMPGWERCARVSGLAAVGAVFSLPVTVDAGIVYSGLRNLTIGLPVDQRPASATAAGNAQDGLVFDLDGDLTDDFALGVVQQHKTSSGPDRFGLAFGYGAPGAGFLINGTGSFSYPMGLAQPVGAEIGSLASIWYPAAVFRYVVQTSTRYEGGMAAGVPAYLGIRFERSGNTHFGWLRLIVDDGPQGFPVSLTLMDWAWNDQPLESILAGQVPEANPALAMLAAAGTGLAAWRLGRRKRTVGDES